MKSLFYILMFSCQISFGQNISYADLISLVNRQKWEEVDLSVMKRGWTYFSSEEEKEDSYGKITWSYGISFDDKAAGWLNLYTVDNIPVQIRFQFHTKTIYNSLLNSIISAGYKRKGSKITDEGLVTNYENNSYEITLVTTSSESDYITKTSYHIQVRKKSELEILLSKPRNGLYKSYDDNQGLIGEFTYKNNILNGPYKIIENEKIIETGIYVNGVKSGKYKTFENDLLRIEGTYNQDEPNGNHSYFFMMITTN